jgi:hypothetical protein
VCREPRTVRGDYLMADAVPANQSPISLSSRPRKIPRDQPIYQGNRRVAGLWPPSHLAQAFELSSESEPKGVNSLNIGSGNNRELREILRLAHF